MIAHPAKEKLAHNGAGEGNGRHIGLGARRIVLVAVDCREQGVDLADDPAKL